MPSAPVAFDLSFPIAGINRAWGFSRQPNVPLGDGRYGRTTPIAQNVRARELLTGRIRGGTRPCLSRYISAQPGSTASLIQCLITLVGVGYSPPGGTTQTSGSGRVVTLVVVKDGNVWVCDAGGTTWTQATNDSGTNPPLNATGIVRATVHNQKVYFADGTHARYYDPRDNKVKTWGVTEGVYPSDTLGNLPRLIGTWRGRLMLSGISGDQQNWFASTVGDPFNWNTQQDGIPPTQAVVGNNSSLGLVGDVVTTLIPYADDTLIFGCDHEIWMMAGDPMAGGQLVLVSKKLGMAFGNAWAMGPSGEIYFFSNTRRIYRMTPREAPMPISQPIDPLLRDIDTGAYTVTMEWDDKQRGLAVFVTKTSAAGATTHFFFEEATGAWWSDVLGNNNHNPLCVTTFDGNDPSDRVMLIGSWDGYVRAFDPDATRDDGTDCASEVWLGPIQSDGNDSMKLRELQAELGEDSGNVTYAIHVGRTAEAALASDPIQGGTLRASRGPTSHVYREAFVVYVKLTATRPWQIERVRCVVDQREYVKRRARY